MSKRCLWNLLLVHRQRGPSGGRTAGNIDRIQVPFPTESKREQKQDWSQGLDGFDSRFGFYVLFVGFLKASLNDIESVPSTITRIGDSIFSSEHNAALAGPASASIWYGLLPTCPTLVSMFKVNLQGRGIIYSTVKAPRVKYQSTVRPRVYEVPRLSRWWNPGTPSKGIRTWVKKKEKGKQDRAGGWGTARVLGRGSGAFKGLDRAKSWEWTGSWGSKRAGFWLPFSTFLRSAADIRVEAPPGPEG